MDGDDFDDWEMDDWEEEAFDEDVYDHSELETATGVGVASFGDDVDEEEFDEPWSAAASVENAEDSEAFDGDGLAAESVARTDAGGERMGWSAWDVGTVFALGGWLADHHADRTAQQVAAALAERNVGRPANRAALSAAHPPPPSGYPYRDSVGSLTIEDPVDQGALFAELSRAESRGEDLMIQAEGPVDLDRPLVLIVSAVPGSVGPRFWVVAEAHPGGFNPSRLIPVFERSTEGKVAIFATDHAHEAVDAAGWACEREGVPLHQFHVANRQLTGASGSG
jgi:hypothetical protein